MKSIELKKQLSKLIFVSLLSVVALCLVVASSYAWYSMSSTPSMSGMQIVIGGSNTIQIAPDIKAVINNETVHYPGKFSSKLKIDDSKFYEYLGELQPLSPVSTADGVHWYFPSESETSSDGENQAYLLDKTLQFSNLTALPEDGSVEGGYVYLDFWVVSPKYCKLRVSAGDQSGGTYLVSLPKVVSDENGEFSLEMQNSGLSSCARIGFLVSTEKSGNNAISAYTQSTAYQDHYRSLKGVYQEKGGRPTGQNYIFSVYEPNADFHAEEDVYLREKNTSYFRLCKNGSYVATTPVGLSGVYPSLVSAPENRAVQLKTTWKTAGENETLLEQIFQAYLAGEKSNDPQELTSKFYRDYLAYQCTPYLEIGKFIKDTSALTAASDSDGVVEEEVLKALPSGNAADDAVIVELEKNVPQRIRMFVWVEGQDVDCSTAGTGGGLLLNLELAGQTD